MSKKTGKAVLKYKPLFADNDSAFKTERSLDTMIFSGSYLVDITHNGADVGLPIEDCGEMHYIVGTLVVTDSGTNGTMQKNRVIGQVLTLTSRENKETKVYSRTFADNRWSEWRSLVNSGMYDNIASTDELVSTVEGLVAETKVLQTELTSEIARATAIENNFTFDKIQDKKLLYKTYTPADFVGIWCKNNTTGEIVDASTNVNGILVKVLPNEIYRIESTSLWNFATVPFFSDVPNAGNYTTVYVGYQRIQGGLTVVPANSAYMLVSIKNPSSATAKIELVGWADKAVSNAVATTPKNLGSEYVEAKGTVTTSTALDLREFRTLSVSAGALLEFIAETDTDVEFIVITYNGIYASGSVVYYKSNILHRVKLSTNFISALEVGNTWGLLIKAEKAVADTPINFRARIINNDCFSYDYKIKEQTLKLDAINASVAKVANVVNDIALIPNNNNYIKNWEIGNKLVTRLYVENKELAFADKLYIRQLFKLSETNYGFLFGNANAEWALSIKPNIGAFDVHETTNYICDGIRGKYGKIAIRIDWEAIDWGTSTSQLLPIQTESNLEDIVFDWSEFVKPLQPTINIADNSITENKLSVDVKEKLNRSVLSLLGYELFSLGDSLSSAGIWQAKVAELTGCTFDQSKNNKGGAMLSVGGTSSYGDAFDNLLWRTKNLIDQSYIADDGENAIVILENVNDGYVAFDGNVKSIIPTAPIEGYNDADFGVELLESISDKAALNAVLRLNKVVAGKNLRIDKLPTKAGTVTLRVGWVGPGYSNYNIYVEPQATQEETLQLVLDKILEYAYTGITDTLGEDGVSVDFSSGNPNYLPTVQFTDTDGTGMVCTVTDNPNAKSSVARYFIGNSIDEWTDTSKWQKGITYSQGWKSSIELLQRTYPKLHIFVSLFPLHAATSSEYLLSNGAYDSVSYDKVNRMEMMRNMQVELAKIAEFYSLPFLNVFAECGIGINNMLTYYNATANVHPKKDGYYRFGETVAAQLKRYLS